VSTPNDRARILVVEDDASILLGLRMALQAEGYVVGTADDGERGMEMARAEHWDLVILDVMLPKLNGFEFLGTLRAERITTPVLVLSARTGEVDKVMGLDLGAVDYMTKPFSLPELLARVRAAGGAPVLVHVPSKPSRGDRRDGPARGARRELPAALRYAGCSASTSPTTTRTGRTAASARARHRAASSSLGPPRARISGVAVGRRGVGPSRGR
jgi:CheY-like chemotaxis protein